MEVHGEVDLPSGRDLADAVLRAASNATGGLVLDLSGTTYLDSAGIHVLLRLRERLATRRQELRLVVPPGALIREVLDLTGVPSVIPVDPSADAALEAMRAS